MDWGNLALGIVGLVGAPFTGGASLGLTTGALAAHGAKSAAEKQSASADKALAELGRVHGQQIDRLNPFIGPGGAAYQRLSVLMGGPSAAPAGANPNPSGATTGSPVLMQAPDGTIELKPAALVAHYQQKGAKVLQDANQVSQLASQDQQIRAWLAAKGLPMPTPHPSAAPPMPTGGVPNGTSFPMPQGAQ